jgi:carotenoid cleavage dioxygenase-like enzyme
VTSGDVHTWRAAGSYPGEPVFVPGPAAVAEDDGVVMSVVLDADRGRSVLLVLDAGSFTELARAEVPHAIPFGFHGQFTR